MLRRENLSVKRMNEALQIRLKDREELCALREGRAAQLLQAHGIPVPPQLLSGLGGTPAPTPARGDSMITDSVAAETAAEQKFLALEAWVKDQFGAMVAQHEALHAKVDDVVKGNSPAHQGDLSPPPRRSLSVA